MKACNCGCANNGGKCSCTTKNPFEKLFDCINKGLGVKRSGCKKSLEIAPPLIPISEGIPVVTNDPNRDNQDVMRKEKGGDLAEDSWNKAKEKTNEEVEFAVAGATSKEEKNRNELAAKLDKIIHRLSVKMNTQINLSNNTITQGNWSEKEKDAIKQKCANATNVLKTQIQLIRSFKEQILESDYENVGYGVYALKGLFAPEKATMIYKNVIDESQKDKSVTVLCKKQDILNIAQVVPCATITDMYWNEFVNIPM